MSLKDLLYLQRNDRQALIAVLAIMTACLTTFYFFSGKRQNETSTTSDSTTTIHATKENPIYYKEEGITHEVFPFDPNTADSTTLARLGLAPWQIRSIYRYRAKGGVYSQPSDFARVYGMTKKKYETLRPFIRIAEDYQPAAAFYGYEHRDMRNGRIEGSKTGEATKTSSASATGTAAESQEHRYSIPHKLKAGERIDINTADTNALQKIPGIGSYYAKTIVRYRDKLGGFVNATQLQEIDGMPTSAIAYMSISLEGIHRLNINKLSLNELRRHPYINFYQAKAICDYRRLRGPIKSMQELSLLPDFPPAEIERLQPYIAF